MGPRAQDALREVMNMGAGHAATALSQMTGLRVMISVPQIRWSAKAAERPSRFRNDEEVISISVALMGEAAERAALVISRDTADRIVTLRLRHEDEPAGELGPLERSTLQELGNIVCASYVGVLGSLLGSSVMIGPPRLEVVTGEVADLTPPGGLVIETDFTIREASFQGVFALTHSEMSFAALLGAIGITDEDAGPV